MYCIVNKTGEYGKYAHYAHPVAFGKHYKCHRLTNSTNKRCIIITIIHVLYFYGFSAPAKFAFFAICGFSIKTRKELFDNETNLQIKKSVDNRTCFHNQIHKKTVEIR